MILDNFDEYLPKFKKIIPSDYKKIVQYTEDFIEHGMSIKEAQIEAFYKSLGQKGKTIRRWRLTGETQS